MGFDCSDGDGLAGKLHCRGFVGRIRPRMTKMTTPLDGACQLRELDEHLPLHWSLVLLPFEVEYHDLFLPLAAAQAVVVPVVAPAQLPVQGNGEENA